MQCDYAIPPRVLLLKVWQTAFAYSFSTLQNTKHRTHGGVEVYRGTWNRPRPNEKWRRLASSTTSTVAFNYVRTSELWNQPGMISGIEDSSTIRGFSTIGKKKGRDSAVDCLIRGTTYPVMGISGWLVASRHKIGYWRVIQTLQLPRTLTLSKCGIGQCLGTRGKQHIPLQWYTAEL